MCVWLLPHGVSRDMNSTFWEPRAVNRVSVQMMFLKIKICVKDHKTERGTRSYAVRYEHKEVKHQLRNSQSRENYHPGIGGALEFSSHSCRFDAVNSATR